MEIKETLDCIGLSCPFPVMRLKKLFSNKELKGVAELLCTGDNTKIDIIAWFEKRNKKILLEEENQGVFRILIQT